MPPAEIHEGDPAVIFYTSGTTGKPKGAISTHRSMIANLQNTVYNAMAGAMLSASTQGTHGTHAPSAGLLTSPLFHVSGCHSNLVVGLMGGVKLVIPVGKFEPEQVMQLIQGERITVWATVPTMVWRVVEHPTRGDYDLSSVTQIAYGGSPSAAELQRMIQATFPSVKTMGNAYGLTESSSVATVNSGQDFLDKPESVGRAMPVIDIRIADANGEALPTGKTGEVWIKGPTIMPGYWGKPEATAETITDGWLHTGDVGYVDEEGFLFITDRAKDMIIRGGENIYCVEIENRLVEHPGVMDAAVIGVPHPTLGEEVKAVIQVEPGSSLTDTDVRAWVGEVLADFKVPTYIETTTDKLPRNASGKLLKNVLRGKGEVSFAETL
jgi:long-chain acyl-CoA synthetase